MLLILTMAIIVSALIIIIMAYKRRKSKLNDKQTTNCLLTNLHQIFIVLNLFRKHATDAWC